MNIRDVVTLLGMSEDSGEWLPEVMRKSRAGKRLITANSMESITFVDEHLW
ncbi:hypothetical protein L4C36_23040 [Photobacterium japonica]|uniref:hypothetical protein n=1 Tax=Photobacterium japonica TaxID=2910235 RepID=UPI003D1413AB